MRQWIILWHILALPVWAGAQVCGLEDTLWINTNSTHTFPIEISGLVNDDLSDPAQGICGVEIEFVHQFSENLELWLTAPDGTTVQLIGPNTDDPLAFTFFARWDISFVPCNAIAMPDSGYAAQWNNDQLLNFVSGGRYLGSYYPFMGCLEDFASGPANGTWTITVVNDPSPFYGGAILDFRLVFCDDRGVDCCFADAGIFSSPPDLTVCRGADTLLLDLRPAYFGRRPDTTLFGYTYVIAANGALIAYDSITDLRNYPAGAYEICGLSYELATASGIPPADSMLSLDSLRADLSSFFPSFCGELTPGCATVVIVEPPDTTFLSQTICFGDTAFVADSAFAATGVYTATLEGLGGCDSIVQLDLFVQPLLSATLDIVICEGDSAVVGSSIYTQSGYYVDTLTASTGCDSIVTLDLTVLQPLILPLDTVICAGDTLIIGAESFWQTGNYSIPLQSSLGCDSTVLLNLTVFSSEARIAEPDTLTCSDPELRLDGASSIPATGLRYIWQNALGDSIGEGPFLDVAQPGVYFLEIRPQGGFPDCVQRDSVLVQEDRVTPVADAGPDTTLTCALSSFTLGGPGTSTGPRVNLSWSTGTGNFSGPTTLPFAEANGAGAYILIATDTINGCIAADTAILAVDTLAPPALAGPDTRITCAQTTVSLDAGASGAGLVFFWTGPCIAGDAGLSVISVDCAGEYVLQVTDPLNACTAFDTVLVTWDTVAPAPDAGQPQTITCNVPQPVLTGSAISGGSNLSFSWLGPGIVSGADSLVAVVNEPGTYTLEIFDTDNGCTGAASVVVEIDTVAPVSDAGPDQRLDCLVNEVALGGPGTTTGPGILHRWFVEEGNLSGPSDQPFSLTDTAGVYVLVVENSLNGCADTSNVLVTSDLAPPFADAGQTFILDCEIREAILDGSNSASGPSVIYEWTGPCLVGSTDNPVAMADCQGLYTLTLLNTDNGCTASDTVSVLLAQATAIAVLPDTVFLSCETGTALIDAGLSVFDVFDWRFNDMPAGITVISPVVNMPGVYTLNVNTLALNCPDSDTTVVLLDCSLTAAIAPPETLTCARTSVILDAGASTTGPGITYEWIGPGPGCITSGQGTLQARVVCPGLYNLIVRNPSTSLADTAGVMVSADQVVPLADAGSTDTITCAQPFGILDGRASASGNRYQYAWTDASDNLISTSIFDSVTTPGAYFLEVIDTLNGCTAVDFVTISQQTDPPGVNFGNPVFPCNRDSFLLRAFPDPPGSSFTFSWIGPGLLSGSNAAEVWIDTTGLYVIEVIDNLTGCGVTDSVLVTQPECGPCIRIAPPDTVTCLRETVMLEVFFCEPCPGCVISWTAQTGEIISGETTATPLVREGRYTLSVTDTAGITATLTTEVIALNVPPGADAGPDRSINCRDSAVMLGGVNSSTGPHIRYTWSSQGGAVVTPADAAFGTVEQTDVFVLEVLDTFTGCLSTDTVLVLLDTVAPVAEAGPDKLITCDTPFAIPDGAGSTLGNSITYLWTASPPGNIAAGNTSLNPIVNAAGVYRLEVENTQNGCSATDSMRVTLADQLPFVPDIPDQALTCADSVALLRAVLPDTAGLSLRWCRIETGNTATDCVPGLEVSVDSPGTYRFEVTDNLTGCRNVDFALVTENKTPPAVDAGQAPGMLSCTQLSIPLSGSAGPPGIPLDIEWSAVGGSEVLPNNELNPVINAPDTFVLRVTRLDNGCSATDSVAILLNDNFPVADAGPDTMLTCLVRELRLQGTAVTTGAPVLWNWTSPDGQILEGANSSAPRINRPGLYIAAITDPANGCTAADSVTVGLDQNPPEIQIDAPSGLMLTCTLSELELDAGATLSGSGGLLAFNWFGAPGSIAGPADSAVVRVGGVGFYRLVVEDISNGCRDTSLVQIGGNFDRPTVSIAVPQVLTCARTEVELIAASSPTGTFISASWILPNGDTTGGSGLNRIAGMPGPYRVWATDTRNGCAGTAAVTVLQDTIPPMASIATPDELDCDLRNVQLDGSASSGRGALSFQWEGPAGGLLAGSAASRATAGRAGLYALVVTDPVNGCRDTAMVEVVELSAPITGLEVELLPPSCPGAGDGRIDITSVQGGVAPFFFALNGSSPSLVQNFSHLLPGSYFLRVQDALGCDLDTVLLMTDPPELTVELGEDMLIRLGDSVLLEAEANLPVAQYRWEPAELLPQAGGPAQWVRPLETTTYAVTVVNSNGCTASDWITLTVNTENLFFVPNAFSPNGDGNNDQFVIFSGSAVQNVRSLRIFDRWGNLVFSRLNFPPNDPAFGWDGVFEGRALNPAVFVVVAELELYNGRVEVFKGDLTLVR